MTFTLGLIADDLTGANDTAVQFARRGWKAVLMLETVRLSAAARSIHASFGETRRSLGEGGKPDTTYENTDHSVLAVTTDARALDNATAEKVTADALAQLIDAGVNRIYLKIDSTMRGSVPGQIAGALAGWRTKYPGAVAVVCPAYPRMGRTVVANQVLVDGKPVERSPIGRDPVTPVTTSDLAVLIPGGRHVLAEQLTQDSAPIVTVDARSEVDLARLASAIAAAGPSIIPVGSAGLAEAMAAVLSVRSVRLQPDRGWLPPSRRPAAVTASDIISGLRNPRILIQVTSLNPVSHAQVARLAQTFPDVVVLLAPAERVGNSSVAETIAATFADRVERETWDVLGLIGGDGARAALRRLDASAIRIVDTMLEGIPLGIVMGGRADGMPIFTKAGGFGAEDALVQVIERMRA